MSNKGTCSIDGCNKPVSGRGWCSKHYNRWYRYGDPNATVGTRITTECKVEGCTKPGNKARGMCSSHYELWRRATPPEARPTAPILLRRPQDKDDTSPVALTGRWVLDPKRRILIHQEAS